MERKRFTKQELEKFEESIGRFEEAIYQCDTYGTVLHIDFKRRKLTMVEYGEEKQEEVA